MVELFQSAIGIPAIIYTALLFLALLYWLLVILGAMDLGSIDFDFDADVDVDADLDLDGPQGSGWIAGVLKFFNLNELPLMVFFSFFALSAWVLGVGADFSLHLPHLIQWILLVPILVLAALLAKFITLPLVPIFAKVGNSFAESIDFLGREGTLISKLEGTKIGQMEVKVQADPIKIYVQSKDGEAIEANEIVYIVDESPDKKFYYVSKSLNL